MSVYVKFDEWGRMGNRMFQYAFGYILAKQKNTDLFAPALPNFNIESTLTSLPNTNFISTRSYGFQYVDWSELLTTSQDIIVDSFVQKSRYYIPYRNELISLFNIKLNNSINQNKLVIHIRETDYCQLNWFLGYNYYKEIITTSGFTDIIIVTDNSKCDTVKKLISEGCVLNTEGIVNQFNVVSDNRAMHDFTTLLYSENIALSPSSFSWWAAFLGLHKKIIFPILKNSIWKESPGLDDIDLVFPSFLN